MDIIQIIQSTKDLLSNYNEWEERFYRYISNIAENHSEVKQRSFRKPEGLSLYSSVGRQGKSYDLRFRGQSVATVVEKAGTVKLRPKEENEKYFGFKSREKESEWHSEEASKFRNHFKKEAQKFTKEAFKTDRKLPKSEEHRIENCLLREFSKKRVQEKLFAIFNPLDFMTCFSRCLHHSRQVPISPNTNRKAEVLTYWLASNL